MHSTKYRCLPTVRPGCARYRAPEISHNKGDGNGIYENVAPKTIYPTIPFILHSPSLFFFIPLTKCESHLQKVTIACYVFLLNTLYKTWLTCDIITVHDVLCVLYYIVSFKIIALDKYCSFWCFLSIICYHTAAFPCKHVVFV